MPPRLHSKELRIKLVGPPSDRVPVCPFIRPQSPNYICRFESCSDMWVFAEINRIIIVYERITDERPKNCAGHRNKQHTKQRNGPGAFDSRHVQGGFRRTMFDHHWQAMVPPPRIERG